LLLQNYPKDNAPPASSVRRATVPPGYRLRLPGPTGVPERVRVATAQPMLSHRGAEFRAVLADISAMLRPIFGTQRDAFVLGTSGTGAMEAALANVVSPGDGLLIVLNGQFGERFASIAENLGAQVDGLDVGWGAGPDAAAIAERIRTRSYRAVVCVHNESSTGVVADIAAIGAVLRDTPTLLVVDSVSGAGGIALRMDAWGIDVLVSGSQKSLMCPPGLAFAAVSEKGMRVVEAARTPRFFFDFRRMKASLDKGETPFTPPVSLVLGLHEALIMIHEEGLPQVLARHHRMANALQAGFEALGLKMFPSARPLSATVTVGLVPEGLEGGAIVRHMYQKYRTVVAGQRTKLSGRVVRIGTMGAVGPEDILTDLHYLEATLRDLGHPPSASGAGIAAAARVLEGEHDA
jgi:aspartate aminotransferase-like enzyme